MSSNLQNKLSHFQTTPPADAWDKIAEALDAEQDFSKRLYDYQEAPKTNVWNKIIVSLEEPTPGKIVPFTTRYQKPIRYIAAASIIAVILISATLLMKRTEAGSAETAPHGIVPAKDVAIQQSVIKPTINPNNRDETQAIVQSDNQPEGYEAGNRQKRLLNFISPQSIFRTIVLKGNFVPEDVEQNELFNFSKLNDYMVYSDGDGNAMKMPKKLFSLVNCPDGDGSCRERIHDMQQKLSSTAMSADFTGVLEMLRQLQ